MLNLNKVANPRKTSQDWAIHLFAAYRFVHAMALHRRGAGVRYILWYRPRSYTVFHRFWTIWRRS